MKNFKIYILLLLLVVTFNYCSKDEEIPVKESDENGFLALNIALEIEELSTSSRVAEVNTDNFIVTIHTAGDGSEVMRFDPFSDAPAEISLPTGEYFVRATNLEPPASAAFDQPYYFGESEIFNIDKEELKTIDVNCTLANYKVSFVFSQNVIDNFTLWNATATRTSDDAGLFWFEDLLPAEGYFTVGSALDISVYLEYTKVFTGELITRTFETTIADPLQATHYRINIDASLEDGKIVINLTVDDSFEVIDIDLGDGNPTARTTCLTIKQANADSPDGIYTIDPDGDGGNAPYQCYCDMTTEGGGWTRVWGNIAGSSGHPATNLPWDQALSRMPQETDNVYTGLNIWNDLMSGENGGELMHTWQLGDEFKSFKADIQLFDPNDNYTIRLTNYIQLASGNGSTSHGLYYYHNNMAFSTFDNDNDQTSGDCSSNHSGTPYWYNSCWIDSLWGRGETSQFGNGAYWGQEYGTGYFYIR